MQTSDAPIPSASDSPSSTGTGSPVDALEQLRRGQISLDKLFFAFHLLCERDDTELEKQAIVKRLQLELAVHVRVVDDVVLDALPEGEPDGVLADEARTQHASIQEMVARIVTAPADDPDRDARVEALGEFVKRHLEHERALLFPRLRQADIDLKVLGSVVGERRDALMARYQQMMSPAGAEPEDESGDPVGSPPT